MTKAEGDSRFRAQRLANPSSASTEIIGIEIPDDFNVDVHEDATLTAHLVLPASVELTDAQLQQAAGSAWCGEPKWY